MILGALLLAAQAWCGSQSSWTGSIWIQNTSYPRPIFVAADLHYDASFLHGRIRGQVLSSGREHFETKWVIAYSCLTSDPRDEVEVLTWRDQVWGRISVRIRKGQAWSGRAWPVAMSAGAVRLILALPDVPSGTLAPPPVGPSAMRSSSSSEGLREATWRRSFGPPKASPVFFAPGSRHRRRRGGRERSCAGAGTPSRRSGW